MNRRKKIYLWVIGSVGVFLILLSALSFLLPRLINLEPLREKISANISQRLGGPVEFKKVDLSFFPRPYVIIHEASLSIPGKLNGTLESLGVYPKILPLFIAKFNVDRLQVKAPDFRISLPVRTRKKKERVRPTPAVDVKQALSHLLAPLSLKAPNLTVAVKNGRLDLAEGSQSVFSFHNIHAGIAFPPSASTIHLTCNSNLWERIAVVGTLDSSHFKGQGRIDFTRFYPQVLTGYLSPEASLRLGDSALNLSLGFRTDGPRNLQADIQGSIPSLTLERGNEQLVIKGKSLKAAFRMDEEKTTVSLTELNLEYPKLSMTGGVTLDQGSPEVNLGLESRDVDVLSTREVALRLAGDIPLTQKICNILKGGKVPLISFNTRGNSVKDLGELENITIEGSMLEGKIFVPGIHLDLEGVRGEVVISKGILQGKNLEARRGDILGRAGILTLGLKGKNAPFHLEIRIQADLAELHPLLKQLVTNKFFAHEMDLIDNLKGNGTGRLVLGESMASVKARVDLSEFNLSGHYQRIPYPLEISGTDFSCDESTVHAKQLSGKLGQSSFSELSVALDWAKEPHLGVESRKLQISLDEIYPWLSSFEGLSEGLKSLRTLKGTVTLSALNLKGPVLKPKSWGFKTAGELKDLSVHTTLLPGPIAVTQGRFEAVPEKISFTVFRTNFLDASINGAGTLEGYLASLPEADMSFEGEMRSKSVQWLSELIKLPSELMVRSPLSISQAHLTWDKGGKISFLGGLAVPNGPKVSMDIIQDGEELTVKKFLVQDEESNATITFNRKKRGFSFNFSGDLRKTTLDTFLVENQFLTGWVKGNFQARVLIDQAMISAVQGKLEGQDLMLLPILKAPLKIDSFSLDAKKDTLKVESAILKWGDSRMTVKGDVKASADRLLLDLYLFADNADWKEIEEAFDQNSKERSVKETENLSDLPVRGIVRLKMKSFKYDRFTWSPLYANISFSPAGIKVAVIEADLCGVSTTGTLDVFPQEIQLDFKSVAKGQELDPTLTCLVNKKELATGKFDFQASATARGKSQSLAESLQGSLELIANKGRFYRFGLLAKIFALLNATEILRGKLPDLAKEGFAYNSVTAKGDLENGKLVLKEGVIDGSSMEIAFLGDIDLINKKLDLKVLVAPLKTVDFVVKKIPLVSYILGGTLVSIPIKATGHLGNPTVTLLSPLAVGSGLLEIMKRAVELPVKMIQPIAPVDK